MNITVKPVGGLGREAKPGRMTFPSSVEIKPRLRAFFSSRFIIIEAVQSPGAGTMAETSGAPLFGAPDVTLAVTPLEVAPAETVEFFFFTISGCAWEVKAD
jgi:hypothetical protein